MHAIDAIRFSRVDVEDELLAIRYPFPVLISARCASTVTKVARRVHVAACSAAAPFVAFPAAELIDDGGAFAEQWTGLMQAARGGSVLITDVEEMSATVQALVAQSLGRPGGTRSAFAARLIAGTTVSLLDRVNGGHFSEQLLYRLNVIHLRRSERPDPCPECATRRLPGRHLQPPIVGHD